MGRLAIGCVAMIAVAGVPASQIAASPASAPATIERSQNVDWLSPETASSLNLGFPVLVPGWVPSPFGGEPSVSASAGYYSLYWMNVADDPTFLQITGQVGGGLPAGSPYDLNNQLFVNASVQGYDAIHDVTPIYDQVWWIQDGVLYSVASKNMLDTDSLSLANSLFALEAPAGGGDSGNQDVEPTEEPAVNTNVSLSTAGRATSGDVVTVSVGDAVNVNLSADSGVFTDTGDSAIYNINGGDYEWQAPAVDAATAITLYVSSPDTGETLTTAQVTVSPASSQGGDSGAAAAPTAASSGGDTQAAAPTAIPASNGGGNSEAAPTSAPAPTQVPSSSGGTSLSDGTDGPPPPIVGGDGTGGSQAVDLPRRGQPQP